MLFGNVTTFHQVEPQLGLSLLRVGIIVPFLHILLIPNCGTIDVAVGLPRAIHIRASVHKILEPIGINMLNIIAWIL